jgi:GNAT superfamily N-acetyltransferase
VKKNDLPNDDNLRVDFSLSAQRDWEGEGSNYIREITGNIILTDDQEEEHDVGDIHLYWLQIGNMLEHSFNPHEACDAVSQETLAAYSAVYDSDCSPWPKIEERYDLAGPGDLLSLEQIKIKPEYRGKGYGPWAIREAIEMFGSDAALVILKPFPLQYQNWLERAAEIDIKKMELDFNKLRQYYAELGFRPLPDPGSVDSGYVFKPEVEDYWAYCPSLARQPRVKIKPWKAKPPSRCASPYTT